MQASHGERIRSGSGVCFCTSGDSLYILITEDNYVNQVLVVSLLQKHGHQVAVANDGQQAIDMLAAKKYV